jgi:small conductance mechanosensitive channel
MQGALSNFAGGIMLLIFRPFSVGDYIKTGEYEGYVRSIKLVYTVIRTFDNRIISLPNGNLMNSTIVNATAEDRRRVDLTFEVSADEPASKVQDVMLEAAGKCGAALSDPAPVAVVTGSVPGGLVYTVRVWTETKDYWTVYEGLMEDIPMALNAAGITRPAAPVRVQGQ